jgi:hypothetical protein
MRGFGVRMKSVENAGKILDMESKADILALGLEEC